MLCKKCNASGTVVIRKIYFFCDECFISNIIHKFRACIGKNTKLTLQDKALICLSGDISSTVLLDLVMNAISLNTHKKLRILPTFLHLTGITSSNETICNAIINQCKNYNVDIHIIDVYNLSSKSINLSEKKITEANESDLRMPDIKEFINKVSPTTQEDFISKIKQNMLYAVAKDFKCNLIFTAETNTKLSAKLLSNIVTGRGSQIENDIGFADVHDEHVKLLRPMREITEEELGHYVRIRHLIPANNSKNVTLNNLQSLITNFISDLQENSPATISTICKTADKIGSVDSTKCNKNCKLCQNNLYTKPDKLIATDAIGFSKMVSSGTYNSNNALTELENTSLDVSVFPHINESLCYSCSKNYYELIMNKEIK